MSLQRKERKSDSEMPNVAINKSGKPMLKEKPNRLKLSKREGSGGIRTEEGGGRATNKTKDVG